MVQMDNKKMNLKSNLTWRNCWSAGLQARPSLKDKCVPTLPYLDIIYLQNTKVTTGSGSRKATMYTERFKVNTPIISSWKINAPTTMLKIDEQLLRW